MVWGVALQVPMLGKVPLIDEPRTTSSEKEMRSVLMQGPKRGVASC